MVATSFFFVSLLALVLGKPIIRNLQVHESVKKVPSGFTLKGPASSETTLKLRLALMQNDPAGLIDTLMDVSMPTSAHYGQHLTKEEVRYISFGRVFVWTILNF